MEAATPHIEDVTAHAEPVTAHTVAEPAHIVAATTHVRPFGPTTTTYKNGEAILKMDGELRTHCEKNKSWKILVMHV